MGKEEKLLSKSLEEWGRQQVFLALERWRSRVYYRCAWLANRGNKLQASIEENLSRDLLHGLNSKLHKYLYGNGKEL